MPSASAVYNSNGKWLNASDLTNNPAIGLNKRVTAVIHHVEEGLIGQDQKHQLICDLVSRQGTPWPKKLTLNTTRNMAMVAAFGDDYSQWPGKAIEVWAAMVPFGGKMVPGIHVGPASNGQSIPVTQAPATAAPASYPPMPPQQPPAQAAPPSATAVAGLPPVAGGRPVSSIPSSPPIEDDEIPF